MRRVPVCNKLKLHFEECCSQLDLSFDCLLSSKLYIAYIVITSFVRCRISKLGDLKPLSETFLHLQFFHLFHLYDLVPHLPRQIEILSSINLNDEESLCFQIKQFAPSLEYRHLAVVEAGIIKVLGWQLSGHTAASYLPALLWMMKASDCMARYQTTEEACIEEILFQADNFCLAAVRGLAYFIPHHALHLLPCECIIAFHDHMTKAS